MRATPKIRSAQTSAKSRRPAQAIYQPPSRHGVAQEHGDSQEGKNAALHRITCISYISWADTELHASTYILTYTYMRKVYL